MTSSKWPLRALLVSYAFPPVGGVGVARVLKLAKYLPEHGVQPAVLTVANPSTPLADPARLADVPAGVEVIRTRTFEPGYGAKQAVWQASAGGAGGAGGLREGARRLAARALKQALVPDAQVLWLQSAAWALSRRLARGADDVVFISGPPFSQFLLAPLARLRPGVGVVLDYRDEWSAVRENYEMMSRAAALCGPWLERAALRAAHVVTTATEAFRDNLLLQEPWLDPRRLFAVPNGYDRDDLPAVQGTPPADKLVITYAGTIFHQNSVKGLMGGLRRLHQRRPDLTARLRMRFIGRIVDTELPAFEGSESFGVERVSYLPHEEALRAIAESHIALCTLDDVPYARRIYPAKIFELMVLGRPTLVLAPEGALTELVRTHELGPVLPPRDEGRIAEFFEKTLEAFAHGTLDLPHAPVGIERYDRRRLAGEFAALFERAAEAAGRASETPLTPLAGLA